MVGYANLRSEEEARIDLMPKKIAIVQDTEDQLPALPLIEKLVSNLGFTSEVLSSEQVMLGELIDSAFDAAIFPGGPVGSFYGLRVYKGFGDAVRYFVANGGGYIGVCGGAYIAGLTMSELLRSYCPRTLGLMDVKTGSPTWIRYFWEYRRVVEGERVPITCKVTDEFHPVIESYQGQTIEIGYSGGPIIRDIGFGVTPLLTYVDDLLPPGDVACCCSIFGKGRVVISSPHPEPPWGTEEVNGYQEWLYYNMIKWASEPEPKAYFPFLPWEVEKRLIPYPVVPTSIALGMGMIGFYGLGQLWKRKEF